VAVLAGVLGAAPGAVLAATLPDMLETPEGEDAPALYCDPSGTEGPSLSPRYFPGVSGA